MTSLTEKILASDRDAFNAVTNHSFFRKAGERVLGAKELTDWLSQDYLYACSYLRFVQKQLDRLPDSSNRDPWYSRYEVLLTDSAVNVTRELGFFEQQVKDFGLQVNILERDAVHEHYEWAQHRSATSGTSVLDYLKWNDSNGEKSPILGAIALWGMEKCYYDAWCFARSQTPAAEQDQASTKEALDLFIQNWTTPEFAKYVDDLEKLVNDIPSKEEPSWDDVMNVWNTLLNLERNFCPN